MKVVFSTDLFSSENPSKDNNHDTIIKFDGIYIAYMINSTQVTIHAISGHHHTVIDSLTIDAWISVRRRHLGDRLDSIRLSESDRLVTCGVNV